MENQGYWGPEKFSPLGGTPLCNSLGNLPRIDCADVGYGVNSELWDGGRRLWKPYGVISSSLLDLGIIEGWEK